VCVYTGLGTGTSEFEYPQTATAGICGMWNDSISRELDEATAIRVICVLISIKT